jgi:hypothetical protein
MSLSIAICLPGIPSNAKRAPTSAIRVAPLLITMKFTIKRTQKTTKPRNTDPPITNCAKLSMTPPAASVPVCPSPIISLVDDTFSERRSINDAKRIVGNAENSNGRSIKRVTVKIKIASENDAARPTSRTQDGIGRTIITIMPISEIASKTVGLNAFLSEDLIINMS